MNVGMPIILLKKTVKIINSEEKYHDDVTSLMVLGSYCFKLKKSVAYY